MSKLVQSKTKTWMPINAFLKKVEKTKSEMYELIKTRQWYNGRVLRKPEGARKWEMACYEEYLEWAQCKE